MKPPFFPELVVTFDGPRIESVVHHALDGTETDLTPLWVSAVTTHLGVTPAAPSVDVTLTAKLVVVEATIDEVEEPDEVEESEAGIVVMDASS